MRPPIPYFGGKMLIADTIAALFPAHQHYVEPYCGSLSVLLAKTQSKQETVNDLDAELMTFWRVLRDRPDDLIRICALTPHSRAEFASSYEREGLPELEVARRVWVALTQGRSSTLRGTGWRYRIALVNRCRGVPGDLVTYVDRMAAVAERLARVSLESKPALEIIAMYGSDPDVLLYVDPPYLGPTGHGYRYDMKSEAEHRELAEALHAARAAVVISGYASDMYDRDLYADWDRRTIAAHTGDGAISDRTEVLWANRALGQQLPLDLALEVGDPS